MNAAPAWADWAAWLGRLAVGSAAIVALTALIARQLGNAAWQRTLWRGAVLGLAIFFVGEVCGAAGWASAWLDGGGADNAAATVAPASRAPRRSEPPPAFAAMPAHLPQDQLEPAAGDEVLGGPRPALAALSAEPASGIWWPGVLWLAGAGVLLARLVAGRGLLALLRRRCLALTAGPVVESMQAVARRLGLRRAISIRQARGALGPATFGVWRPTLLLPQDFATDFEPAAQEAILAHELAHLAARDAAWQLLSDLVVAFLWWQPLVWWARARLLAAAETAADDASLVVADGPGLLAGCLVALGKRQLPWQRPAWLGAASGFRSNLGRRVERLLHLPTDAWRPPRPWRARLLLLFTMLIFGGGTLFSTAWAHSHIFSEGDETMMQGHRSWKRSLAGIVLVSTFTIGAEPASAEAARNVPHQGLKKAAPPAINVSDPRTVGQGAGAGPAADADDGQIILKVFRLQHRDPEALANIAHMLLTGEALPKAGMPGAGGAMMPGGLGPMGPGGFGPMPGIGAPGPFGGALGALGGAPGGFGGAPGGFGGGLGLLGGAGAPGGVMSQTRFAPDKRTRALIVRGPKSEVQIITDLVAVLDLPADKQAPNVKNLHIFRLKHAEAKTVREVFQKLFDIPLPLAEDPETRSLIILPNGVDDMAAIRQIIEALDVAVPEGSKEKK